MLFFRRGFSTFHALVAASSSLYLVLLSSTFDPGSSNELLIRRTSSLSDMTLGVSWEVERSWKLLLVWYLVIIFSSLASFVCWTLIILPVVCFRSWLGCAKFNDYFAYSSCLYIYIYQYNFLLRTVLLTILFSLFLAIKLMMLVLLAQQNCTFITSLFDIKVPGH